MWQFQASLIVIKLQWFFWYITKAKNHWHKRKTWNRNERYWVLTLNVLLLSIEHEIVGHKYCAKIIITFSPYVSLKIWDVDIRILISHDIYLITLYTCLFLSFYYSVIWSFKDMAIRKKSTTMRKLTLLLEFFDKAIPERI